MYSMKYIHIQIYIYIFAKSLAEKRRKKEEKSARSVLFKLSLVSFFYNSKIFYKFYDKMIKEYHAYTRYDKIYYELIKYILFYITHT